MESSTDDDSNLGSDDTELRTRDIFNDYSEQPSSSDINKDSHYTEMHSTMPAFENYYNHSKKRTYKDSSSSDTDDDQQYSNMLSHNQTNINNANKSKKIKSSTVKKRKLDNKDENAEEYNHWQEVEKTDNTYINESKDSNLLHTGKAQRMMKSMGYQPGIGLGKHGQGRIEPIEPIIQLGRRGLGHYVPGLKEAGLKWDPEEEEIKVVEDIKWLSNIHPCTLTTKDMIHWMKLGPKKLTIDNETTFCSAEIVTQVINSKSVFDKLDKIEMRKARTRSNPYETIRSACFLNRAAVKMANINRACNFMFTDSKNLKHNELLYFADVCAGPGGFSEYVLSRKKWHAKGFGFTLKNENDFTLDEFFAGPCETFHPFYGSKDNGDVFDPKNQEEFRTLVMKHTYGKGVHFMMSDGGFSVEGQENIQEILSKQLYLCQCLVALMIVRQGGHFVTKLFDLFTPFSAGLVYLMYRCFDSICIFKPNSSRPANSERYLICKRKKSDTQAVMEYLSHVNHLLLKKDDNNDVIELVPLDQLEADENFLEYLKHSNEILGKKQIIGLLKIAAFCENPTLSEPRQADMRKECLKYWDISNKTRVRPYNVKPQDKIKEIVTNYPNFIGREAKKLTKDNINNTVMNQPYDWYCIPCSSGQYFDEEKTAAFYLGLGRRKVYRYVKGKWDSIGDVKLELPANTLIYAELVYESKWTGKNFTKSRVLHILDTYMLGGENVSSKYITDRHMLSKKLCDALWKPSPHDYVCVRTKQMFMFGPNIEKELQVAQRRVKSMATPFEFSKSPLEYDDDTDTEPLYFALNSILFLRSVTSDWHRQLSKSTKYFYVYNPSKKQEEYENRRPPEAEANFIQAFKSRVVWYWPQDNNTLNMNTLIQILNPSPNV